MNYYPFHLGDYAAHTAHLEPMEDLAYRRMLDLYYRTEKPLPECKEEVARLIRMKAHTAEIADVLKEFFTLTGDGWRHFRCDGEIASFKAMAEGGRKGAAKRWAKAGDSHPMATPSQPQCQPEPKPEPKPKEETKAARERAAPLPCPDGVTDETWRDWLALRKAKRAPVTATVIREAQAESVKAGLSFDAFLRVWCGRGSQGLSAEWLKPHERASPREALSKWIKGTSLDPDFQGYPDDDLGEIYGNAPALR